MKKYWKVTTSALVTALSIGTFYASTSASETHYPEFTIEKQSGNAAVIENLVLNASYEDRATAGYLRNTLKITDEGSIYSNPSFLNGIIGNPPTVIKEYQDKYRDFMRGKGTDVNSFFEDEEALVYTNLEYDIGSMQSSDFKFFVSVLDKSDKSVNSFTIPVPEGENFGHIYVQDIQKLDNKLTLVTRNMRKGDNITEQMNTYTIDLDEQEVINDEPIFQSHNERSKEYDLDIHMQPVPNSPTQATENLVFFKQERRIFHTAERVNVEELPRELLVYNIPTGQQEDVDLPDSLQTKTASFTDGSTIYFTQNNEDALVVTPYDIENRQTGDEINIPFLPGQAQYMPYPPQLTVQDNKLYVISTPFVTDESRASVHVIDLSTGETLYEGEIKQEDPQELDNAELHIYKMTIG